MSLENGRESHSKIYGSSFPLGGYPAGEEPKMPQLQKNRGVDPSRNRANRNRMVTTALRSLQAGVTIVAFAFVASEVPSLPAARIAIQEHVHFWPYNTGDCEPGWDAPKVDPTNLARGMRDVYEPVVIEYNETRARSNEAEHDREFKLYLAQNALNGHVLFGAEFEKYDEPREVACQTDNGTIVMSSGVRTALEDLSDVGYAVDPMTGSVTLPS